MVDSQQPTTSSRGLLMTDLSVFPCVLSYPAKLT